ncbi:hypothetical protein PJ267_08830 [Arthrobacter sp. OVS8]|nr:hypothetical protein PJ267_08830 [Arthrobacter sp. OVS8]
MRSFRSYDLDRGRLAAFDAPVLFVMGALSNPDQFGEIARRLSAVFPDFRLEVFAGRHHFDPRTGWSPDGSPSCCVSTGTAPRAGTLAA